MKQKQYAEKTEFRIDELDQELINVYFEGDDHPDKEDSEPFGYITLRGNYCLFTLNHDNLSDKAITSEQMAEVLDMMKELELKLPVMKNSRIDQINKILGASK
jgi:hypothetical protein